MDAMEEEEDVDVLWEGSPLHQHLAAQGVQDQAVPKAQGSGHVQVPRRSERNTFGVTSMVWPPEVPNEYLEIEVAQKLLGSDLLVQEDQDFVSNFILTDEALESHRRKMLTSESSFGSHQYLSEALLISGSLAAVVGTVLYLSERMRVAATVARSS